MMTVTYAIRELQWLVYAKIPRAISDFHRSESLKSVDISERTLKVARYF